jgi:ferritin-like metal-binding protein YciE
MGLNSLEDVLKTELEDLHSAETQLTKALPKMAKAASNEKLKKAFEDHLEETKGHIKRLEEALGELGVEPEEECKAMKGLIAEGEEILEEDGDDTAKDAAIIAAAQKVEHYEIASYGTVRQLADELGLDDIRDLMEQTLDEESNADKLLTKIATSGLNQKAAS